MKLLLSIFFSLLFIPLSAAAPPSSFIDDAPKGFIHVTNIRHGEKVQIYLRAKTVSRIEPYKEETGGKSADFIRIYIPESPSVFIMFATAEEATECLKRLLEMTSSK